MTLCLIRCGETSWDREKRVHGSTDLPMSDAGRASVQSVAKHCELAAISSVYHPDDEAATETARIFAEALDARTRVVEELADPNLGLLEGLTDSVFADRYPRRYKQWEDDPLMLSPPEGEEFADARARIFAAVARILKRSKSDDVAIVLHPVGLGFLRCWLADLPARDLRAVLHDRPTVEQYALTGPMIQWLEEAAAETPAR